MTFLLKCRRFLVSLSKEEIPTNDIHSEGSPPCCCVNIGETDSAESPGQQQQQQEKFKKKETAWADFYSGRPRRGVHHHHHFLPLWIFVYQDICGMPCRINGDVWDARRDIFLKDGGRKRETRFLPLSFISIPKVQFAWPTNLINNLLLCLMGMEFKTYYTNK